MFNRYKLLVLLSAVCSSVSGCGAGGCDEYTEPAFVISVFDQVTGDVLCDVEAMAVDGSYVDTDDLYSDECPDRVSVMYLAYEREGTYQIVVSKEGYETWSSDEIVVFKQGCHVTRNEIDVFLQPE